MGRQRPASVTNAIRVQMALVTVGAVLAVLTVVRRHALAEAWVIRQDADLAPPSFAPVAVVLFITLALLAAVLTAFFRDGHPAARITLVGLSAFFLLIMVVLVRQRPPAEFVAVAVVAGLLDLVLLFFLLHKDTSEFVRGAELAQDREA